MNLERVISKNIVLTLFLILNIGFKKILNLAATYLIRSSVSACGKNFEAHFPFHVRYFRKIEVGNDVSFLDGVCLDAELEESALLKISDNVRLNKGVKVDFSGGVHIGKDTLISEFAKILTHSHGYDPRSKPRPKALKIGSSVWIGTGVIITENVSYIGDNSIVATGSIVTKDIDANSVYAGVPARKIKEFK